MTILISGATGYLAANLINFAQNHHKYFDNFDSSYFLDRNYKDNRIQAQIPNLRIIETDLSSKANPEVEQASNKAKLIIHSAYLKDLEAEKAFLKSLNPQSKLVYFSSSAVYGEHPEYSSYRPLEPPKQLSLKEAFRQIKPKNYKALDTDYNCKPISGYGKYKLEIEQYIQSHFKSYLILRITNPYAGEFSVCNLHQILIKTFNEGQKSFKLNSDYPGQTIRDFIEINDFTKQVFNLISNNAQGVYNIGSNKSKSLEEFVAQVYQGDHSKLILNYCGSKAEDIQVSRLYCSMSSKLS